MFAILWNDEFSSIPLVCVDNLLTLADVAERKDTLTNSGVELTRSITIDVSLIGDINHPMRDLWEFNSVKEVFIQGQKCIDFSLKELRVSREKEFVILDTQYALAIRRGTSVTSIETRAEVLRNCTETLKGMSIVGSLSIIEAVTVYDTHTKLPV